MNRGLLRLLHLREQTEAVDADMIGERARFKRLRKAEAPRAVSAFNLFQTPPELADCMVANLPTLGDGSRVLEPSAGLGRLFHAIRRKAPGALVTLVESSPDCCAELYRAIDGDESAHLAQRDFLNFSDLDGFDFIVMNPPFKRGADVKHIKHARGLLKPGGVLVALCYDGSAQNKHLKPIADTWTPLGSDLFKTEGTRAAVVMMTLSTR